MSETANAALNTVLSFHYQTLIGIEECFKLEVGQSIYFERDGDVSFLSENPSKSHQIEVKNYSGSLTNHHENFWKTLQNWLLPEFKHEQYQTLILYTTQSYGKNTLFKDWNAQNTDGKLTILKKIKSEREKMSQDTDIAKMQYQVMATDESKLKSVIAKIVLFTESEDLTSLQSSISKRILGIRKDMVDKYLESLIGFVYKQLNKNNWVITYEIFHEKLEELTHNYSKRPFTFPNFINKKASKEEFDEYQDKLFVCKIKDIDYEEVIPTAIGNYLELINSLYLDFNISPSYKEYTDTYRMDLISKLEIKHRKYSRNRANPKDFYDEVFDENPFTHRDVTPDLTYRNGLVHDIMDDNSQTLKWDTTK